MNQRKVSRAAVLPVPAERVFDVLASPHRHPDIDGSGSLRGTTFGPDRLELGAEFGMRMRAYGVPYHMRNRVVEFEPDRLIAWRHSGPHRWRWETTDLGDGTCQVRGTFDYSTLGPIARAGYVLAGAPARNARGLEGTLERMLALFGDS